MDKIALDSVADGETSWGFLFVLACHYSVVLGLTHCKYLIGEVYWVWCLQSFPFLCHNRYCFVRARLSCLLWEELVSRALRGYGHGCLATAPRESCVVVLANFPCPNINLLVVIRTNFLRLNIALIPFLEAISCSYTAFFILKISAIIYDS